MMTTSVELINIFVKRYEKTLYYRFRFTCMGIKDARKLTRCGINFPYGKDRFDIVDFNSSGEVIALKRDV